MKLLARVMTLAAPSPEYSAEMQRAQQVEATWIARDGVRGLIMGCQDIRNAERLEEYVARLQSRENARARDFAEAAGVMMVTPSRVARLEGAQRLHPMVSYIEAASDEQKVATPLPILSEAPDRGRASATLHSLTPRPRS